MKAHVYELVGPRALMLSDADVNDVDVAADEVIAQTEYSVVSPGTELAAWSGKPPLRPSKVYPRLVGYCNVARVVVSGDAAAVPVGSRILTHQSHRSAFRCHAGEVLLSLLTEDPALLRRAAALYLFHLGYVALLDAGFRPGMEVAIIGQGALGYTTGSLTAAFGARPYIFTGRTGVASSGYVEPKDKPLREGWLRRPDLDGVDIVVNTSDLWDDYLLALQAVRKGGTVVLLGFPGRGQANPDFNVLDSKFLYDKQVTLRQVGHVTDVDLPAIDARFTLRRNLRYLFDLMVRGTLDPAPLIAREVPWRELSTAYAAMETDRGRSLSVLLDWTC